MTEEERLADIELGRKMLERVRILRFSNQHGEWEQERVYNPGGSVTYKLRRTGRVGYELMDHPRNHTKG